MAEKGGKREMINRAQEDIHKEPTERSARRNSGPGPEKHADMKGAFDSNPGRMNLKSLGKD